jgi:hypothetical protein
VIHKSLPSGAMIAAFSWIVARNGDVAKEDKKVPVSER